MGRNARAACELLALRAIATPCSSLVTIRDEKKGTARQWIDVPFILRTGGPCKVMLTCSCQM
jgi:hypothetical protein